jgi:MFS family permease
MTARREWAAYGILPVAAAIGYSTAALHTYMLGPLMEPLQKEFGWTRTEITSGLALVNTMSAVGGPMIGALVDRLGPRLIALVGVPLLCAAIALLSTATGTLVNWMTLWGIIGITYLGVNGAVWSSAVASRFHVSRGLALGITLSGGSVTTALAPLITTTLIGDHGWRAAVAVTAAVWGVVATPVLLLFFRGAQDVKGGAGHAERRAAADLLPGYHLKEALRMPAFYQLLFSSALFAICILGSAVHFVPMLMGSGADKMTAASAASVIGVFSIVGRLTTGFLLDRFPAQVVGAVATLIPAIGAGVLLWGGAGHAGYFVAAASFGLTLGSEFDLMSYLTARQFGLKRYGVIVGVMMGSVAFGGVVGPLAAGAAYDRFGDYSVFLTVMLGLMVCASLLIATIRRGPDWDAEAAA